MTVFIVIYIYIYIYIYIIYTDKIIHLLIFVSEGDVKCRAYLHFMRFFSAGSNCLIKDILPKNTNIKVNPAVRDERFTKEYRKQLVTHGIETKEIELKQIVERLGTLREQLSRCNLKKPLVDAINKTLLNFANGISLCRYLHAIGSDDDVSALKRLANV